MQPSVFKDTKRTVNQHAVSFHHLWRSLLILSTIAVAYFLTARAALSVLNLGIKASPVWPPAGIAFAAVLWQGRWAAIGVALGAGWANYSMDVPWLLSLGSILGSSIQPIVGRMLLKRFKFQPSMERLQDVLGFVGLAVLVAPMTNATIGTLFAYALGHLSWSQVAQNWWTIWLGDGMGILIFTPSLLALREWMGCPHDK
ncbi:MAG TPA: MASE1 domain-containing protein, partial [Allocoleopsis sp.]